MKNTLPLSDVSIDALARISANIKTARLRRDLTQKTLADRAGIGKSTLARLESGDHAVSIGVIAAVLDALALTDSLRAIANPVDDAVGLELERLHQRRRGRQTVPPLIADFPDS